MRGLRAKLGLLVAPPLVSSCGGGKSETLEKREPRQPSEEAAERTEPDRKSAAKPRLARVDCAEFEQFAEVLDKSSTDPNIKCATVTVPIDLADTAVFQNTPEWNGNLTLSYAQPLSAGWGSLLATLTGSYRDSYHMFEFENPLLDQTEDYTLVDASVAWTSANDKLTLQLTGRNLTDEEYKIGGYQFLGALFGNIVNSFYGPPRTVSLSASYRFD